MRIIYMQACFFLAYGMLSGVAFNSILEQRECEAKAAVLMSLPISALSHIKVTESRT
jgi:hypothetical protein